MKTRSLPRTSRKLPTSLLEILPQQGDCTEEFYLALTDSTNRLIEFTDGYLETLPMPTNKHQSILKFLFLAFNAFLSERGGVVQFAALRLRIREGKFREPDLLMAISAADPRIQDRYWTGADAVLEVVSPDDPRRDLIKKRRDYAEARIPEYWIVNPLAEKITVLVLRGKKYQRFVISGRGSIARSSLLQGFEISTDAVFDAK